MRRSPTQSCFRPLRWCPPVHRRPVRISHTLPQSAATSRSGQAHEATSSPSRGVRARKHQPVGRAVAASRSRRASPHFAACAAAVVRCVSGPPCSSHLQRPASFCTTVTRAHHGFAVLRGLRGEWQLQRTSRDARAPRRRRAGAHGARYRHHSLRTSCRENGEMMLDETTVVAKLPVAHYVASVLHGDVRARTRC